MAITFSPARGILFLPYSLFPITSSLPSPSPRATKIQQPKNFLLTYEPSPTTPPLGTKKSLPTLSRANHGPIPDFFGPNQGQFGSDSGYFGSEPGYFGSIPGFPGQNHAVLGPVSPSREPLSAPGNVQKLHPPVRASKRTLFPKITHNNALLSQIIPNSPLSVYR